MLDTSEDLEICESEIGSGVEELFTPLTRRLVKRPEAFFAMDNGAFSKFNRDAFLRMLEKHEARMRLCRWVAAPDVVGSAIRTIECFGYWSEKLRHWPLAFVAQDGQEHHPIPWDKCEAVFIGGSTSWKLGCHAAAIVKACKVIGKWCHIGRVNTPERYDYFDSLGADSCDGTGLARYSHMRKAINSERHPTLL